MSLMDASGSKCQLSLLWFWHSVSKNSKSSAGQFFRWFVHVTFIIDFVYLFFSSTSWSGWHSHIYPKWLYSACHSSFENMRKMNGRGEARYDTKLFFCLIVWFIYLILLSFHSCETLYMMEWLRIQWLAECQLKFDVKVRPVIWMKYIFNYVVREWWRWRALGLC